VGDILILEAVLDLGTHCIADFGIRSFALGHTPDRNIAISDHPDELIILSYRQEASVDLLHKRGGTADGVVRFDWLHVPAHNSSDFHCCPPLSSFPFTKRSTQPFCSREMPKIEIEDQ